MKKLEEENAITHLMNKNIHSLQKERGTVHYTKMKKDFKTGNIMTFVILGEETKLRLVADHIDENNIYWKIESDDIPGFPKGDYLRFDKEFNAIVIKP